MQITLEFITLEPQFEITFKREQFLHFIIIHAILIIGFDVHLDENSPHIHCTIIPVTPDGKVNFKQVFCPTREAGSKYLRDLHTDYWIEVGGNYGLTRGDTGFMPSLTGKTGSCSDQSPWGEKEHEMDRKWAMECMRRAQMMLRKPKERTIRYGRGR